MRIKLRGLYKEVVHINLTCDCHRGMLKAAIHKLRTGLLLSQE